MLIRALYIIPVLVQCTSPPNPLASRFNPIQSIESSWNPDAPTNIGTETQWYAARCEEPALSTAAATDSPEVVIGVLGETPDPVYAFDSEETDRNIRFDEADCSGVLEHRPWSAIISGWRELKILSVSNRIAETGNRKMILTRHRKPMQRRELHT